jgi:hypothetical protein
MQLHEHMSFKKSGNRPHDGWSHFTDSPGNLSIYTIILLYKTTSKHTSVGNADAIYNTMNSTISRLTLSLVFVGLVNSQLIYDGRSDCLYEVMQNTREILSGSYTKYFTFQYSNIFVLNIFTNSHALI